MQNDMEVLSGQARSGGMPYFDSNFKPNHWTDAQIFHKRAQILDLEAQVQKNFAALTENARKQLIIKQ